MNDQNQNICTGGNNKYICRWQSGMQYHLRICFLEVAFKIVSYVIYVDVPGVFIVINGDGKPEK